MKLLEYPTSAAELLFVKQQPRTGAVFKLKGIMEQEERNKQDLQVDQEVYQLIEIGENAKAWQLLGTEVRKEILVTPPFGMQWTVILRHLYPEQDTAAKDRSIDP